MTTIGPPPGEIKSHWPMTPGPQPCNRIGPLTEQLRRVHQPRPVVSAKRGSRGSEILTARVSELERLLAVVMLRQQRGAA